GRQKRRTTSRGVLGGHGQHPAEGTRQDRLGCRRSARGVDVSLPHPRAPCDGNDGALRRRGVRAPRRTYTGRPSRLYLAVAYCKTDPEMNGDGGASEPTDRRLRVLISSSFGELLEEREAASAAVRTLL